MFDEILNEVGSFFVKIGLNIWAWMKSNGPNILGAIAIIIIGWWLAVIIAKGVRKALSKSKVEKGAVSFIYSVVKSVLVIVAIVSGIAQLGVNITSVIAALGAAGITAGLALKDTLSNFASGIFILFNKPFVAGDYIEIEGSAGTVVNIELMFTTLRTPDNKHIVFPNSKLTENKLINHTGEQLRRFDACYHASYETDVKKVKSVLNEVYENNEYILHDGVHDIVIGISEFADSSVIYEVRAWIKSSDYSPAKFDLNEKVKEAFDANGIAIPFNRLDVTVNSSVR